MNPEEKQARLNLLRYGMLLVVVVAMTVTPATHYLVVAPLNDPVRVVQPTIVATLLAAVIAAAVYFAYSNYLKRQ